MIAACMPEPHILLTVVASTDLGRPGLDRRLAGRGLAEAGGQHAAHVDLARSPSPSTPGALDRGADGGGAELGRAGAGERALEAAHRGAGVGEDDDGIGGGMQWLRLTVS